MVLQTWVQLPVMKGKTLECFSLLSWNIDTELWILFNNNKNAWAMTLAVLVEASFAWAEQYWTVVNISRSIQPNHLCLLLMLLLIAKSLRDIFIKLYQALFQSRYNHKYLGNMYDYNQHYNALRTGNVHTMVCYLVQKLWIESLQHICSFIS